MDELETLKAKVAELEGKVSTLEGEKAHLQSESSKLEKENASYLKDNYKLREKLRTSNVEEMEQEIENYKTRLGEAEDFKAKYQELEGSLSKANREKTLTPILNKLGVVDAKALSIAIGKLDTIEDEAQFEEEAKKVVTEYSFLVTDKKFVPDTGKSRVRDEDKTLNESVSDYYRDKFKTT